MIPNMWYAVLSSKELPQNKVVAVRRFSQDLVFFRNAAGQAGCITSIALISNITPFSKRAIWYATIELS